MSYDYKSPALALKVFNVLAGSAMQRRLITYGELNEALDRGMPVSLNHALGLLGYWCKTRNLPPINTIVVNAKTGEPGTMVVRDESVSLATNQWNVFNHPWFAGEAPTLEEIQKELPNVLEHLHEQV